MHTNFLGKSGFYWWLGRIENRVDPMGLLRVQVRIWGFHGDDSDQSKLDIPNTDLPWAQCLVPLNSSTSANLPPNGTWVIGFFLDGESAQYPVVIGAIPGFNAEADGTYTSINGQVTSVQGQII